MKLRKFTGKNTRDVLRLIREELGGDAMIVSSRQTATGVEMIAMSSADAQSVIDDGGASRAEPRGHAEAHTSTATSAPHTIPVASNRGVAKDQDNPHQATLDRYAREPRMHAGDDAVAEPLPGRRVPAAEQLIRSTASRQAAKRETERSVEWQADRQSERQTERHNERPVERSPNASQPVAPPARAAQGITGRASQLEPVAQRRAIDTEIERAAAAGRLYDEQTERSFLDYALSISPQARDLAERALPSQAADDFQRAMQAMPQASPPMQPSQDRQPAMPTLAQAMDRGSGASRFPAPPAHPTGLPTLQAGAALSASALSAGSSMAPSATAPMARHVRQEPAYEPQLPASAAQGAMPPSAMPLSVAPSVGPANTHGNPHVSAHASTNSPAASAAPARPAVAAASGSGPMAAMAHTAMQPGFELENGYANGAMPAYSPVWAMAPIAPPATVSIPAPPLMGPAVGHHASSMPPTLAASMAPFVQVPLQMVAGGIPMQPAPSSHPMLPEHDESDGKLAEAFRSMRDFLAQQWAGFAWRDATLRHPAKALLWRDLTDTGFSPALARLLAERLPDNIPDAKVRDWLQEVIARNVSCAAREDELVEMGGAYALVGPTGVGKTTTAAKIAARCVVRHGTESLGLISTDGYRIGAQDQLRTYGRILGVPVYTAQNADDLRAVLATMSRKRLVLVDAMGVGQRDTRVAEQTAMFDAVKLRRLLVLSASSQPEALEEVVSAYTGTPPGSMASTAPSGMRPLAGVVLSKLDESVKIGCALDAVMRHKLRIQYVATGQRVPEDLHLGNASVLAHKALRPRSTPAFKLSEAEYDLVFMPPPVSAADGMGRRGF